MRNMRQIRIVKDMSENPNILKKCEKCGRQFECQAHTGHCWCENFELSVHKIEEYRKLYKDCLCMECLNPSQEDNQTK